MPNTSRYLPPGAATRHLKCMPLWSTEPLGLRASSFASRAHVPPSRQRTPSRKRALSRKRAPRASASLYLASPPNTFTMIARISFLGNGPRGGALIEVNS